MATLPHAGGALHADHAPLKAVRTFRGLAAAGRFRVIRDAEGWPVIPGTLGRLEYHEGAELAVYTDRPRLFARLWAVPGVRPWQVGDQEVRGLVPPEALPAVAALIRARRRRPANAGSFRPPRHSATSAA
jgi:hypothetical protein